MLLFVRKPDIDENINPSRKKQKMYVVENEMSVAICGCALFPLHNRGKRQGHFANRGLAHISVERSSLADRRFVV
jgi:hypothetical protein